MTGLSKRFAVRVSSIQQRVTRRADASGKTSYGAMSAKLGHARQQVAKARRGR